MMNRFNEYVILLIGVAVVAALMILGLAASHSNSQPEKSQSTFEVVDHYKGCDLLQWTNSQLAEYKYFLYCPK
jgi:hypothetical protein